MRTILLTGGAGIIGNCLLRQLLAEEQDVRVVNLDKLTYVELTVQWYLDNSRWVDRVTSGKYRRERLGLNQEAVAP